METKNNRLLHAAFYIFLVYGIIGCGCNQSTITEDTNKIREKNIRAIKNFFELMHQKKLDEWNNLRDENGFIYIPYPVANFPDTIKTKKTIAEGFKKIFAGFRNFDYRILNIYPSVDPYVIVVEYTVSAVLIKTNTVYNGKNIAGFKFYNGKIVAYHDYFNPEKFKMVVETMQ